MDVELEAGPSQPIPGPSADPFQYNIADPGEASSSAAYPPSLAPSRPLPSAHFYSVEYPGFVRAASAPLAIARLGGPPAIDAAFRRATGRDHAEPLLELRLRPGDPYAHPVPGEVVPTSNVVLKVVKRTRKRRADGGQVQDDGAVGEYTVEAVGVVPKTVRFRSEIFEVV